MRDRMCHVGYFLIDKGYALLSETLPVRVSPASWMRSISKKFALPLYAGSILALAACVAAFIHIAFLSLVISGGVSVAAQVFLFVAATGLTVSLVNSIVTVRMRPTSLPRMDFSEGVPPEFRTLVVVPAMLSNLAHIESLVEKLEVRYLANRDENVLFGLLTDFNDAIHRVMSNDEELLSFAKAKIEELNERYAGLGGGKMFLFHRGRLWNETESCWMGFERKRGKLADLNDLLRGGKDKKFDVIVGRKELLGGVRFVITLDTDTVLPRDAARDLAGTLAHPLNKAVFDARKGRVTDGYGILQPRVSMSLPGSSRSRYSRLFASDAGIDPYTRAVSDVYQDLFGEGSFVGKGIYDVDAFTLALKGRMPENRILSHDLLEGCYARSALVSDVQLFEESPSLYSTDVDRRRRWMRGDWQLVRWLFPGVPSTSGHAVKNPLSLLSRWKILDNLRRSLSSQAITALFVAGWLLVPRPLAFTCSLFGLLFFPPILASIRSLRGRPADMRRVSFIAAAFHTAGARLAPVLFDLAVLPYDACVSLAAIVRTVGRMLFTHRHLLEWKPSEQRYARPCGEFLSTILTMWTAPVLAFSTAIALVLYRPDSLIFAFPVLLLWFVSPLIAWWTGKPLGGKKETLSARQSAFVRRLARKTWAYFETFVNAEENWLPPDNYQEIPVPKIAHRTSPTNMGFSLLANLAASDFGYISAGRLLERSGKSLDSMASLERYRGHFFNWYDTQVLRPLLPRYISTVDSGNLAACLMTLQAALKNIPDAPVAGTRIWDGLLDTFENLSLITGKKITGTLMLFSDDLDTARNRGDSALYEIYEQLGRFHSLAQNIVSEFSMEGEAQEKIWADSLVSQCGEFIDELEYLVPWIGNRTLTDPSSGFPVLGANLTLFALGDHLSKINRICSERYPTLIGLFELGSSHVNERIARAETLSSQCEKMSVMDFSFLYNPKQHLFTIGYTVESLSQDSGFYDLLASEARLSSFVAIAQDQVTQENWFALGRLLTDPDGEPVLLSWSGSMFEYLMPLLLMPSFDRTLLDQSCKGAVNSQIHYGKTRGVPWGISESGFNTFDVSLNYQYRSFGVPSLGLKRSMSGDLVIAPYASALALMVSPVKSCANLQRLSDGGFEGDYGLYEAIDYTKSRQASGKDFSVVRSFMAHHEGMSLLSFASNILGQPMQKRFASLPAVQATILLLEEKRPRSAILQTYGADTRESNDLEDLPVLPQRAISGYSTPFPEVQILSNGNYQVMITNSGGGYSKWNDLAVTRWQEDISRDNMGSFLYIRDCKTGNVWSNTYQPTLGKPDFYEVIFSEGRAEFRRRDHEFDVYTEIVVSPEDDIELRRIRITNRTRNQRTIEVTSFSELVLGSAAKDRSHPCFSKLFLETEIVADKEAILCARRPGSADEEFPLILHLMCVRDAESAEVSFETSREVFVGRGKSAVSPMAMEGSGPLSGTQGAVLDPIAAIRRKLVIEGEMTVTVDLVMGISATRDTAMLLAEKYRSKRPANRAYELSRTRSQIFLQQIGGTESDARLYNQIAGSVIYAGEHMRIDTDAAFANTRGQSGLWGYSISGDLPIVLLVIKDPLNIALVRQLVQAHSYWHQKGLETDLMIWNEEHGSYRQQFHEQILLAVEEVAKGAKQAGGIFVRFADQMSVEDRILFRSVARVIIDDSLGTLDAQINRLPNARRKSIPLLLGHLRMPVRNARDETKNSLPAAKDLLFWNGIGGFSPDGREYVMVTDGITKSPMPWTNVIANERFGTVVSESCMSYTWAANAHEFRLTPWYNDPVSDTSGEALYVRDEDTGSFWSPTPLPKLGERAYITRHGFGYSVYEYTGRGIRTELWVYVAVDAPVKFMRIKVRNESGRSRKLSVSSFFELVLGEQRSKSAMHAITEIDRDTGAIFARNPYSAEYSDTTAFLDVAGGKRSVTGDRLEFIGRNGTLANPDAMLRQKLSGRTGSRLDPCLAAQVSFELSVGQEQEFVFVFGAGKNVDEAKALVRTFRDLSAARKELEIVREYWETATSALTVETPEPSLDILANGWLVYQTISGRLLGRSGFYQSGGAFGFRDQLQDVMALVSVEPALVRKHLLLCASRQYPEGDVQHWWHPPNGQGSRTHCSDDYLWLPLAVSRYVSVTGDSSVLDEIVPFVEGPEVKADEESYYALPEVSAQSASLYDHCVLSIRHGSNLGAHGLPLMGGGDWNDGMNLVGHEGKGESVWLGFFLYEVLSRFERTALLRGDSAFSQRCAVEAQSLRSNLEKNGWDGEWYLRAWFDDGTPLGSAASEECRIDSIAQSWAVLSGAGETGRSIEAMKSLDAHLASREQGLIKLLDPPFDKANINPGYIKGYLPGVRENGGQYTHAAIWAAMAFAKIGDGVKAWEYFGMINPVNHSDSPEKIDVYKVDPYVMAADVYSASPHSGRGGWTWYTGSAGWMYRFVIESLLGLNVEGNALSLDPCLPGEWKEYRMTYRYGQTMYRIKVTQTKSETLAWVDGVECPPSAIPLVDDRKEHLIEMRKYTAINSPSEG